MQYYRIPKHTFGVSDLEVTIHRFSRSVSYDKNKTPFRIFPMEVEGTVSKEAFELGYLDWQKTISPFQTMTRTARTIYTRYIQRPSFLHNWVVKDSIPKIFAKKSFETSTHRKK